MAQPQVTDAMLDQLVFATHIASPAMLKNLSNGQLATYKLIANSIAVVKGYDTKRIQSTTSDTRLSDTISIEFTEEKYNIGGDSRRYFIFDTGEEISTMTENIQMSCTMQRCTMTDQVSLETHIFDLLALCRSQDPSVLTTFVSTDSNMLAATGVSATTSPALREVMLLATHRTWELHELRPTPGHEDLIKHIVEGGPPSAAPETAPLREALASGGAGGPFLRRDVEAAMIRGGWRRPEVRGLQSLRRQAHGAEEEHGAKELVDALVGVGFLATRERREEAIRAAEACGSSTVMDHVRSAVSVEAASEVGAATAALTGSGSGIALTPQETGDSKVKQRSLWPFGRRL